MKRYLVHVKELHVQTIVIEADDAADAIDAVIAGEGTYEAASRYLETLDSDTWEIEEENANE